MQHPHHVYSTLLLKRDKKYVLDLFETDFPWCVGVLCLVLVLLCITWDPFLFYDSLGWGRVGCFAFVVVLMCLVTVSFVVFSVLCFN